MKYTDPSKTIVFLVFPLTIICCVEILWNISKAHYLPFPQPFVNESNPILWETLPSERWLSVTVWVFCPLKWWFLLADVLLFFAWITEEYNIHSTTASWPTWVELAKLMFVGKKEEEEASEEIKRAGKSRSQSHCSPSLEVQISGDETENKK